MALFFITGAPGIGKSTITKHLQARHLEVYDLDDPQFGGPHNIASGERVTIPPAGERDASWFKRHEWRIYRAAFDELRAKSRDNDIIICGVAESDNEIIDLFDKVIYLRISDSELKKRLLSRIGNDYGKNEAELTDILARKKKLDEKYMGSSVICIDASGSEEELINKLLVHIRPHIKT